LKDNKELSEILTKLSFEFVNKSMTDHKLSQNYAKLLRSIKNQKNNNYKEHFKLFHTKILKYILDISDQDLREFID